MSINKDLEVVDLKDVVGNAMGDAEIEIRNAITANGYKDESEINNLLDIIRSNTRSEMTEKYRSKEKIPEFIKLPKNLTKNEITGSDLPYWLELVLSVPLYQSLGDTIGYKNGDWEFNYDQKNAPAEFTNELIYEFIALGGINDLSITHWRGSDDTILYLATYRVLTQGYDNIDDFGKKLRLAYLDAYPKIIDRGIGITTKRNLEVQKNIKWDKLQYSTDDSGSGAAMRSGCIGMFYLGVHNRRNLIALATECSRITHNSATAILGSIVAALFTAYALEKIAINLWPHELLKLFRSGMIDDYIKDSRPREYTQFAKDQTIFISKWESYISKRFNGVNPKNEPSLWNPVLRYKNLTENFSKGSPFPGSNGDDSVIMAYDALLLSGNVVEKIIVYSILHPGDSDTVGSIALSWFGAYYHSPRNLRILESKFAELEFIQEIDILSQQNIKIMTYQYFYNIYLNTAQKYINLYAIKNR